MYVCVCVCVARALPVKPKDWLLLDKCEVNEGLCLISSNLDFINLCSCFSSFNFTTPQEPKQSN